MSDSIFGDNYVPPYAHAVGKPVNPLPPTSPLPIHTTYIKIRSALYRLADAMGRFNDSTQSKSPEDWKVDYCDQQCCRMQECIEELRVEITSLGHDRLTPATGLIKSQPAEDVGITVNPKCRSAKGGA